MCISKNVKHYHNNVHDHSAFSLQVCVAVASLIFISHASLGLTKIVFLTSTSCHRTLLMCSSLVN